MKRVLWIDRETVAAGSRVDSGVSGDGGFPDTGPGGIRSVDVSNSDDVVMESSPGLAVARRRVAGVTGGLVNVV